MKTILQSISTILGLRSRVHKEEEALISSFWAYWLKYGDQAYSGTKF